MGIEYLDGRRFGRTVVAGADWVRHTREHINRINVFPVADGDTGTNMALSLAATAAALRADGERHLGAAARRAAEASVMGAKGNSGLILAHWFLGLAHRFDGRSRQRPADVAESLQHATSTVYDAIEAPVEGTIVTVMRAVSARAARVAADRDLAGLLAEMLAAGREALGHTPQQLGMLARAGVVDAGGQGYVNFLEGAARAVRGEPLPDTGRAALDEAFGELPGHDEEDISERFCTEVVVRGRGFESGRLRRRFRGFGSSLLVACTGEVFKLHVHTNQPDEVLRAVARLGTVEERKVDDMLRQREERASGAQTSVVALDRQPPTVAVVCDSTADLPVAVRARYGIEIAPLQVLFGDQVFRDQVDLSTAEFYQRLRRDPHHPTTSQPPPRAFVEALDRVRADREALVVTISAALSGTAASARNGARLARQPRIEVFDSGSASLGLGMMTLNAARLAATGAGVDELLAWLMRWREDSGMIMGLATLEYLRRGGRIGAARSLVGNLLGLRPILTFEHGRVAALGRARGAEVLRRATELLGQRIPAGARVRIGLVEIGDSGRLDGLEQWLRERCDVVELLRGEPSGVIGAHAGPGAWGVFYQRVRDDDPLRDLAPCGDARQ